MFVTCRLAFAAAALALAVPAQAQTWPAKPIRVLVAFAPGGIADIVARLVAQRVGDKLGQPIVVENRVGAGGLVATRAVASAPPDGYTLLSHTASIAVNATGSPEATEIINDLAPVALTSTTPTAFLVNASHPAQNLQQFLKTAKDGRFSFSSAGVATTAHLSGEYVFRQLAKADPVHVPFQGGPPAITAVLSQQVDVVSTAITPALPYIKQGKLRVLAVLTSRRVETLPGAPTITDAGLPEFEDLSWVGILAPAKTDAAIVQRLNREINDVMRQPDVRERLAGIGLDSVTATPQEFGDYLKREVAKWARVVRETGIRANP